MNFIYSHNFFFTAFVGNKSPGDITNSASTNYSLSTTSSNNYVSTPNVTITTSSPTNCDTSGLHRQQQQPPAHNNSNNHHQQHNDESSASRHSLQHVSPSYANHHSSEQHHQPPLHALQSLNSFYHHHHQHHGTTSVIASTSSSTSPRIPQTSPFGIVKHEPWGVCVGNFKAIGQCSFNFQLSWKCQKVPIIMNF